MELIPNTVVSGKLAYRISPDPLVGSDILTMGNCTSLPVSGSFLKEAKDELRILKEQKRLLQKQFRAALIQKRRAEADAWHEAMLELVRSVEESLGHALASADFIERLKRNYDKVCYAVEAVAEIVKAVRMALRRRQVMSFCGKSLSKRAWFLLHGSNPPPTVPVVTLGTSFGIRRN